MLYKTIMDEKEDHDKSSSETKLDTESNENAGNKDYNELRSILEKSIAKNHSNKAKLHNFSKNRNLQRPNSVILSAKNNMDPFRGHATDLLPVLQRDASDNHLNNFNGKQLYNWSYLRNPKTRPISYPPSNINRNSESYPPLQSMNFHLHQTFSHSTVKENFQCDKTLNLPTIPNDCDTSFNKESNDSNSDEREFQKEKEIFQVIPKTMHEKTDETDYAITRKNLNTRSVSYNEDKLKFKEIKTSFSVEEGNRSQRSLSENGFESESPNFYTTDSKVNVPRNDGENVEDENFFDAVWMHYVERTLLPLKPLQKQKSLSCTNLVQAIKGLSKKKTSISNRLSSPENILVEENDMSNSSVNISRIPDTKQIEISDDYPIRKINQEDSLETQDARQSLNHYQWYHMVDAKEACKRLLHLRQNGAFLIRPASNPTKEVSHTLSVVYSCRVYNFHIKNLKDGCYSLGGRKNIENFSSLLELIKYHQNVPITIRFAGLEGQVYLLITPPK